MGEKFTNTHTPSHLNKHSLLNITFQYILRETNFTTNSTVKRTLNNAVPQKLLCGTPASINQYMYTEIMRKSEIYTSLPQQLQCLIKSLIARPSFLGENHETCFQTAHKISTSCNKGKTTSTSTTDLKLV